MAGAVATCENLAGPGKKCAVGSDSAGTGDVWFAEAASANYYEVWADADKKKAVETAMQHCVELSRGSPCKAGNAVLHTEKVPAPKSFAKIAKETEAGNKAFAAAIAAAEKR